MLPSGSVSSAWQAYRLFIPMAARYLARHLTVGSWIRLRRQFLRRCGRAYYL